GQGDRGQRTEDRGQRTKDRGQRTEDRGQRAVVCGSAFCLLSSSVLCPLSSTSERGFLLGTRPGRRRRGAGGGPVLRLQREAGGLRRPVAPAGVVGAHQLVRRGGHLG